MPDLPHLILPRVKMEMPRRKTGYGRTPAKEYQIHGQKLKGQIDRVLSQFSVRRPLRGINPNLILRIHLDEKSMVDEETWERCGLILLSIDENNTLVLFSSDQELTEFKRRLDRYHQGPPTEEQKSARYSQIFACINEISEVRPIDRIGRLFRAQGIATPEDIHVETDYIIDVELWDLGNRPLCVNKINEIRAYIESRGGRVSDEHVGDGLVLMRVKCKGELVRDLLEIDSIAVIDFPPQPTLTVGELLDLTIADFPSIQPPHDEASSITVLDSGITSAHPMLAPAIGEATTVPLALGDVSDGNGHGTMVAGLALYGDVKACIESRSFIPQLRLFSARVLNDRCEFDDENLITSQMRNAIQYFQNNYNCRVFNISLGDRRLSYSGGKVSPWASILDTLARELNVVIVVSAGNFEYNPGQDNSPDSHVQDYPHYLLNDEARIIEPATVATVLTVGALAHVATIPPGSASDDVAFRPIAQPGQPSPFTRSGFGLGDAIKPELCDYGGNFAYDGRIRMVRNNVRELSVISLNRDYLNRLFTTACGTSFAAPRVAHMAARLFDIFPDASANLIRALLAVSASVPEQSKEILEPIDKDAPLKICGYGQPCLEKAQLSDENRVVLYSDSVIELDNFHIYEIPIPEDFIQNKGTRNISVVLAFDPPVRHSRFDYLGLKMSFRLIRGTTAEQIEEAFRRRTEEEGTVDRLSSTGYKCELIPKLRKRGGSTLQKAKFTMHRNPHLDYGETYFLVVMCEKKWAKEEHSPQRYAVVVELEHSAQINIYNTVRQMVTIRLRARRRA